MRKNSEGASAPKTGPLTDDSRCYSLDGREQMHHHGLTGEKKEIQRKEAGDTEPSLRGGAVMAMELEEKKEEEEVSPQLIDSQLESEYMRGFIRSAATKIRDERLLKMLYIRAKTLQKL